MARASRAGGRLIPQAHIPASKTAPKTVASLGVQARLLRVDRAREREFAQLLARYERLCQEWDRLLREAINLLDPEFQPHPPDDGPPAHKDDG